MSSVEELLAPIAGDSPGGRDVSYDADRSQIDLARGVIHNPDPRQVTDEDRYNASGEVIDLARKVIEKDSKDLTVAAFMTEALLRVEEFAGLADGLELLSGMMETFWDDMFPEDAESRAYAIDFLTRKEVLLSIKLVPITDWNHNTFHFQESRGGKKDSFADADPKKAAEDTSKPTGATFEAGFTATTKALYKELDAGLTRSIANLERLTAVCEERFAGEKFKPSLTSFGKELKTVQAAVAELLAAKLLEDPDPVEPEPVMEVDVPGEPGSPSTGGGAGAAAAAIDREPTSTTDAAQRIGDSARYLRAQNPHDPAPYLVLRALRWGELRAGGATLDVRLLHAPPTDQRTRLKQLSLDGQWEQLLEHCEAIMATPFGRGWLDLQRYVSTALENLGGSYKDVDEAILAQLKLLLADLPELADKTMMDDTPTANAETKAWLERVGVLGNGVPGDSGSGSSTSRDDDPERERREASYAKAREWAASGNPRQGVELLMRRANLETSARARFITQMYATSIMMDHGMVGVARPILQDLVQECGTRKLEEWEAGEVVARVLGLLYRSLPEGDRSRDELYDQICKLDPVQALELVQGATPETPTTPPAETNTGDEPEPSGDGAAVDS